MRYTPVSLKKAVAAFFDIEKRRNPQLMKAQLSQEREFHYRDKFEEAEQEVLCALAFDLDLELPYRHISEFCLKHVPVASRDSLYDLAVKFCNDSFKLPLCLFFHPKELAAACVFMAALWRKNKGFESGLQTQINGHPWYKWVDPAIEQ